MVKPWVAFAFFAGAFFASAFFGRFLARFARFARFTAPSFLSHYIYIKYNKYIIAINIMVKNFGGNKSKKQGSKYQNTDFRATTRFSKHPDEIYAVVIKEYGGGRALIKCIDGDERILIIRNKFKGKSKRQNYIKSGVWVLAGKREWERLKASSKENCDLLEVYTQEDANFLRKNVEGAWEFLAGQDEVPCDDGQEGKEFTDICEEEFTDICEEDICEEDDDDIDDI